MYQGRLRTIKAHKDTDIEMSTEEQDQTLITSPITATHSLPLASSPQQDNLGGIAGSVVSNDSSETAGKRSKMTRDEQMARRRLRTDTDEYRTQERERMRRRRAREKEERDNALRAQAAAAGEDPDAAVASSGKGVSTRRSTAAAASAATPKSRSKKAKGPEVDEEDDDEEDDEEENGDDTARDSRRQSKVNTRNSDKIELPTDSPDADEMPIDTALTGEPDQETLPFPYVNVNAPRSSRSSMPTAAALAARHAKEAAAANNANATGTAPKRAPSKRGRRSTGAAAASSNLPQYISNNTGFVPSASQSPPPAQTTHFMPPPPPVVMLFGYPAGANPPCNVALVSVTVEHTVTNRVTMMTADDIRTPIVYSSVENTPVTMPVTPSPAAAALAAVTAATAAVSVTPVPVPAPTVESEEPEIVTTTTTIIEDPSTETIIEETTETVVAPETPAVPETAPIAQLLPTTPAPATPAPSIPITPLSAGLGLGVPLGATGGKFLWEMVVEVLKADVGFDPEKEELVGFHHKDPLPLSCDRHINTAMNMAAKEGVRMPKWYIYSKERR